MGRGRGVGGQLSGGSCSGRNYSGKNVWRQKSTGQLPWAEFLEGQLSGCNCPRWKILRSKSPGGIS